MRKTKDDGEALQTGGDRQPAAAGVLVGAEYGPLAIELSH